MSRRLVTGIVCAIALTLSGCTGTKYLGPGQKFYGGAEIRYEKQGKTGGTKNLTNSLLPLITPERNTKVLGMRPGVWFYYRQKDETKTKGLKAFLRRKLGQAPVLMSDVRPERIASMLTGQLQNEGYFASEVKYDVKEGKHENDVVYTVLLHPPYRLREINFPTPRDSVYARIVRTLRENTYLKEGQRYELARLAAEQERIETEVEDYGIYYFDDRYLIFEADSTVGYKQVDLDLRLEPGMPQRAKRIYSIGEINIYPNFMLDSDTTRLQQSGEVVDSMNYYDVVHKFRPKVITNNINLGVDKIYSRTNHSLTLSHLMDMGVFKFVNIQYAELFSDSNVLKADIFLTPMKQKSVRAEFRAVSKSNSFVGPGLEITHTNRNLFGGAELFELRVNGSYEVQIGQRISGPLNSVEFGAEAGLTVPRFMFPFKVDYSSRKYLPKTDFRIGYDLQNRVSYFRLNSFNASAGYTWRETDAKSHQLYPMDITYVQTASRSPRFDDALTRNPFLAQSLENQFILGSRYTYTLNNQLAPDILNQFKEKKFKTHSIFFSGSIQLAGNLLNLIQDAARDNETGAFELFGVPYSQFVRGDIDFRHYWQLDKHNKLASRLVIGTGYPFGNSDVMPYIRQFSIGGSNSIRAFPARSLGPGTYYVVEELGGEANRAIFIDQRADIKLEGNVELRFDIVKAFKGAVFVDAGNIWSFNEDSRPGGKFEWDDFYDELAVGTGLGFRFDFNFFVLRFDVAFPVRKPFLPKGDRWVFHEIDLDSSKWRRNNLIFNIAIGYPF